MIALQLSIFSSDLSSYLVVLRNKMITTGRGHASPPDLAIVINLFKVTYE